MGDWVGNDVGVRVDGARVNGEFVMRLGEAVGAENVGFAEGEEKVGERVGEIEGEEVVGDCDVGGLVLGDKLGPAVVGDLVRGTVGPGVKSQGRV